MEPTERDQVREVASARFQSELQIITVIRNVLALERPPQNLKVKAAWNRARPLDYAFDDVQIGQTEIIQALHRMDIGPLGVAVQTAVIDRAERRQANADALTAADADDCRRRFEQGSDPILPRSAIGVVPFIGAVPQKPLDQVPVGRVDFDAVEAGSEGVLCRWPRSVLLSCHTLYKCSLTAKNSLTSVALVRLSAPKVMPNIEARARAELPKGINVLKTGRLVGLGSGTVCTCLVLDSSSAIGGRLFIKD
jgi:hypothetical protein